MANLKKAASAEASKSSAKTAEKASSKAGAKSVAKSEEKPLKSTKAPAVEVKSAEPLAAAAESLKIKALVENVAALTSTKKTDAKVIVETVLAQIGTALFNGVELNLPHLGRLKLVKSVQKGEATQLTVKIKRAGVKAPENNN